jgi:hypothetical protein
LLRTLVTLLGSPKSGSVILLPRKNPTSVSIFNPLQWGFLIPGNTTCVVTNPGDQFQSPSMGLFDSRPEPAECVNGLRQLNSEFSEQML